MSVRKWIFEFYDESNRVESYYVYYLTMSWYILSLFSRNVFFIRRIHVILIALINVLDCLLILRCLLSFGRRGSDRFNRGRRLHDWLRLDTLYGFRRRNGFRCWRYVHRLLNETAARIVYCKNTNRIVHTSKIFAIKLDWILYNICISNLADCN